LAAILKMAAKMTAILKSHWSRSYFSKNILNYVTFFLYFPSQCISYQLNLY
jgi:hypothetical protein